jgi:hypothetical protein
MGNCVDQEMAQSQRGPDIETDATRQAHFIKWTEIFEIPDPCGPFQGFQRIVAIYIKYVQCGVNYNNKQALRLATVQGYAKAVNTLFKLQNLSQLADLLDPNNMAAILVNNLLKEEDIARQRSLFNNSIFTNYDKCQTPAVMRIKSMIFCLTLWLSATKLGLA